MSKKIVSSRALAEELGCSEGAVSLWIKKGMPWEWAQGRAVYQFDMTAVIKWLRSERLEVWVYRYQNRQEHAVQ